MKNTENEIKKLRGWVETENPSYEAFVRAYGNLSMFSAFTCMCKAHSFLCCTRRFNTGYSDWKPYYEDVNYRLTWLSLAAQMYDHYVTIDTDRCVPMSQLTPDIIDATIKKVALSK